MEMKNSVNAMILLNVMNANPNGDPGRDGAPRINFRGFGEISSQSLKRQVRDNLQRMGEHIYIQNPVLADDKCTCLFDRAFADIGMVDNADEFAAKACERWLDVRLFGSTFAYKKNLIKKAPAGQGFSASVTGAMTMKEAMTVAPVHIEKKELTKIVKTEPDENDPLGADTKGGLPIVAHGLYVVTAHIDREKARRNGLTEEDVAKVKEALKHIYCPESSSSTRPDGSIEVVAYYWWRRTEETEKTESAKVYRTVKVRKKDGVKDPLFLDEYEVSLKKDDAVPEPEIVIPFPA